MSQPVIEYPIRTKGRPDHCSKSFGITQAKKHQKYVHGRVGLSSLMHRIIRVDLHWYAPGGKGDYLVRLAAPHRIIAVTSCGMSFFLQDSGRSGTCDIPKPNAVLCGRCHGEGPTFGRYTKNTVSKSLARITLGCSTEGTPNV